MKANFDFVAPHYDRLAKLIFGRSMFTAQTFFLSQIPSAANVLIIGGGTGWLLAELLAKNPTCKICYIEASAKMLELSASKIGKSKRVKFIHVSHDKISPGTQYDAVVTHFLFDSFRPKTLEEMQSKIAIHLHNKSVWLVSEFINTTWWHSALLKVMYAFFYLAARLSTNKLADWRMAMKKNGFAEMKSQTFFKGFIVSSVWAKSSAKNSAGIAAPLLQH